MAKLGFKAVKSYYKVNKHGEGDPTILWPQKFETNFQFNSFFVISKFSSV